MKARTLAATALLTIMMMSVAWADKCQECMSACINKFWADNKVNRQLGGQTCVWGIGSAIASAAGFYFGGPVGSGVAWKTCVAVGLIGGGTGFASQYDSSSVAASAACTPQCAPICNAPPPQADNTPPATPASNRTTEPPSEPSGGGGGRPPSIPGAPPGGWPVPTSNPSGPKVELPPDVIPNPDPPIVIVLGPPADDPPPPRKKNDPPQTPPGTDDPPPPKKNDPPPNVCNPTSAAMADVYTPPASRRGGPGRMAAVPAASNPPDPPAYTPVLPPVVVMPPVGGLAARSLPGGDHGSRPWGKPSGSGGSGGPVSMPPKNPCTPGRTGTHPGAPTGVPPKTGGSPPKSSGGPAPIPKGGPSNPCQSQRATLANNNRPPATSGPNSKTAALTSNHNNASSTAAGKSRTGGGSLNNQPGKKNLGRSGMTTRSSSTGRSKNARATSRARAASSHRRTASRSTHRTRSARNFRGRSGGTRRVAHAGRRSDIRLKQDIVRLGQLDSGIGIYRFRYQGRDHTTYVGVMAQEVRAVMPEAVWKGRDGYLRVDYDLLGIEFMTWDRWRGNGRSELPPRN